MKTKKLKNRLNLFKLIILGLVVILIASVLAAFYTVYYFKPVQISEIDVEFEVTNFTGINVDGSALNFGAVNQQGGAERRVIITNDYDFPVEVSVYPSESVQDYLRYEPKFSLSSGQEKTFKVTLVVSEGTAFDVYKGNLRFVFIRQR